MFIKSISRCYDLHLFAVNVCLLTHNLYCTSCNNNHSSKSSVFLKSDLVCQNVTDIIIIHVKQERKKGFENRVLRPFHKTFFERWYLVSSSFPSLLDKPLNPDVISPVVLKLYVYVLLAERTYSLNINIWHLKQFSLNIRSYTLDVYGNLTSPNIVSVVNLFSNSFHSGISMCYILFTSETTLLSYATESLCYLKQQSPVFSWHSLFKRENNIIP